MARPKSGTALTPAEKQRRYRQRLAVKRAAKARRQAEALAVDQFDVANMPPRRLAELLWGLRGRKDALAIRTRITQIAADEDKKKGMVFDAALGVMVRERPVSGPRRPDPARWDKEAAIMEAFAESAVATAKRSRARAPAVAAARAKAAASFVQGVSRP